MKTTHKLSYGTAYIDDNIIEIVIDEGEVFDETKLVELFALFDKHFSDREFGYISNRINSYSINLSPGLYTAIHKNLKALAAVCYTPMSKQSATFERKFYKYTHFEIFSDVESARKWLKSFV